MRIGIDMRGLLTGKRSGVEQYTLKILENLLSLDHHNTYVLFYVSYRDLDKRFEKLLVEAPFLKQSNVEVKTLKWVNFPLLLHAVWKPLDWPKVDKICNGLDLMWLPFPRLLPLSRRCKLIITFHDLIPEIFPQFYTWQSRLWQWQMSYPYLARRAEKIIAVSESTAKDLVQIYGVDAKKIQVVYEGVDDIYFSPPSLRLQRSVQKKFKIDQDFIYYVGSIEPRKNLPMVIRGLAHIKAQPKFDKMKLVISGGKSWLAESIYEEVNNLKLKKSVIFTGQVTEMEKIALLYRAKVFAFPSLYEGFGLPVIEAFATGCPVITSNVSALPEVAGGAAALIDPKEQASFNQALEKILTHASYPNNLITKGKLQAKKFSWAKAANQTLNVFLNGSH
ncbi:glycosyltransferase family 4 protein [Patescibacteria group bacterium]|nr:glycosyltransferase family 4 protein [Patescibacteria group bacterium]